MDVEAIRNRLTEVAREQAELEKERRTLQRQLQTARARDEKSEAAAEIPEHMEKIRTHPTWETSDITDWRTKSVIGRDSRLRIQTPKAHLYLTISERNKALDPRNKEYKISSLEYGSGYYGNPLCRINSSVNCPDEVKNLADAQAYGVSLMMERLHKTGRKYGVL